MTTKYEQAKNTLQYLRMKCPECDNAIKVAIDALEKQIPQQVLLPRTSIGSERFCPRCGTRVGSIVDILTAEEFGLSTYCDACGQALRGD